MLPVLEVTMKQATCLISVNLSSSGFKHGGETLMCASVVWVADWEEGGEVRFWVVVVGGGGGDGNDSGVTWGRR